MNYNFNYQEFLSLDQFQSSDRYNILYLANTLISVCLTTILGLKALIFTISSLNFVFELAAIH